MYITETTDNVRELMMKLEKVDDISTIKFLLYVFNLMNNDQINDCDEPNPHLFDENLTIFNAHDIGYDNNWCLNFLNYNIGIYNLLTKENELFVCEYNGEIMGLKFDDISEIIYIFSKLSFIEKLDVISEIIIRYDNETLFKNKNIDTMFAFDESGYDIAYKINIYKSNYIKGN